MKLPDLYLDEDAQSGPLIRALRSRGLSVTTTSEAGMSQSADEEQLRFAASRNMVLVTCNIADFGRLHTEFLVAGQEHAGIILIHQQRWGAGELARRMIRLLVGVPEQRFHNRLEFLSNW